ncbi:hypothetical protein AURDEDRAFT_177984 [Auricularia subglabra TFB-10046 SS5]|uniref:Uncharacterized protein n=1 Tax=Auricularia subglabra (strain TFB-10046 / SS5) TaxID=717982 RepID=J0D2S0_AURST|nr:hypothetical protein AURDEDRAFT_177984 [Auricularia subglabra TFB-10046 SS5]
MADVADLLAEVQKLSLLVTGAQQQAQERHRDYAQAVADMKTEIAALQAGRASARTQQATATAAAQPVEQQPQKTNVPQPAASSGRKHRSPDAMPHTKRASATRPGASSKASPEQEHIDGVLGGDEGDDDDESLSRMVKKESKKRGSRTLETNKLNAFMRATVQAFLGYKIEPRDDDEEGYVYSNFPLPAARRPLPESLDAACSYDWDATPSAAFNKRVIELLADECIERNNTGFKFDRVKLKKKLVDHLRYLCDVRRDALTPPDPDVAAERRLHTAANTRKNGLSNRRLAFIYHYELAQYFSVDAELLQYLFGAQCTSDDEVDDSFDTATCRIRRLSWRNKKLTALLRLIDKCIALIARRKSGSNPHDRIDGPFDDGAVVPEALPENWFDDEYLDGLSHYDRQALLIQNAIVVDWFGLHKAVMAVVARERSYKKGRKTNGSSG